MATDQSGTANDAASWELGLLPEERRRLLASRLRDVAARTPHYSDLLADLDLGDSISYDQLQALPVITKPDIIAAQRNEPPYGGLLTPGSQVMRTTCSPGPEYLAWSEADWEETARAIGDSFRDIAGISPQDVVDITLTYHWVPAGTLFDEVFRTIGCHRIPGGPGMSELHLDVIRDTGVTVIFGFTPFVERLAERAGELGQDAAALGIRVLIVGGELRDEAAKQRLSDLWGGAATVEFYGVAEMGIVAIECPASDGMHLVDHVVTEIIDPDTGKHTDPATGGEIVVTDMLRQAMPIVRYRTGDITEGLNFDTCACGSDVPRLGRILGRRSSIQRVRGLFLNPEQVTAVLSRQPDVGRYQIRIDRTGTIDELCVHVECEAGGERRREEIANEIRTAIRLRPEVRLVPMGSLDAEAPLVEDHRDL